MGNTFTELQEIISDFVRRRDWQEFHIPKNLAMSIAIEAAELMEIFQWMTNEESINRVNELEVRKQLLDEIADVLIYSLSLANVTGVDLEDAIRAKMERNEHRFPQLHT